MGTIIQNRTLMVLSILAATFLAYYGSLFNEFNNWDELKLIINNKLIRVLSFDGIREMFSSFRSVHYKPLVFLSWAFEYKLYGLDPFYFHLDNLLLHLLNTLLVFWFLQLITREFFVSFWVSLLFGVHPLHVESVVWLVERKDVLYSLFYLGSMISWWYFIRHEKWFFDRYCTS
ncbi:MAG: hypothetical protein IH946_09905 [Bacteroidetes bacterium]|nr:hypothetical protein [Bacteroidota bacterium]